MYIWIIAILLLFIECRYIYQMNENCIRLRYLRYTSLTGALNLTSCAKMTFHVHVENFLSQNCNIFSISSIFKYNPGKANNKFITSRSFLSSDIIPTSSKGKESDESLHTVRSLVMVRNQLPAQVVKRQTRQIPD